VDWGIRRLPRSRRAHPPSFSPCGRFIHCPSFQGPPGNLNIAGIELIAINR
jgi:hypothetical protein